MAILSKGCRPNDFESYNSLKISFTNIWGICSNFVEHECGTNLESNSPDILALCETSLNDSIDSGNFSVRYYLPLIWKDSINHTHGLAVYVKEPFPFAWDLSVANSCMVFYCISSNIDEFPFINTSADVFVFGDFNIHLKDWLVYSGRTDRPVELCYNISANSKWMPCFIT